MDRQREAFGDQVGGRDVPATVAIPSQEDREWPPSFWQRGPRRTPEEGRAGRPSCVEPGDSVRPFDRTADRVVLASVARTLAKGIQRLSQIMARHADGFLPVVVDLPRVTEAAFTVKDEEVGSMVAP